MKLPGTKREANGERGFTLLEMMLVIAIGALIMGGLGMTIHELSSITIKGQAELKVQHQLQNVAAWLNRDVVSASQAVVDGTTMTLTQPYYAFGQDTLPVTRTVSYSFSEESGTLSRTQAGESQLVGREISAVSFQPTGTVTDTLWVTVTASYRGAVRSSGLKFDLRVSE